MPMLEMEGYMHYPIMFIFANPIAKCHEGVRNKPVPVDG